MKRSVIPSVLIAATLLLSASLSCAAESNHWGAGNIVPADKPKTETKGAKAKNTKVKVVDINSASKASLKTLPGIGDAEAAKIIAGRPYLSKAELVTENALPREVYEGIKALIVAKQNEATAAKLNQKQLSEKQRSEKQKGR